MYKFLEWLIFLFVADVVETVRWLDLQLPMQSVSITTKVVNLNPANGKM